MKLSPASVMNQRKQPVIKFNNEAEWNIKHMETEQYLWTKAEASSFFLQWNDYSMTHFKFESIFEWNIN